MSNRRTIVIKTAQPAVHADTGFTLMEMLVSLVLLSLTAGLLTASLRTGRTALNAVGRMSATIPVAATQTYLRQAFAQAQVLPRSTATNAAELNFSGSSQAVAFNTSHAPQGQFEGLYRIDIGVAPSKQRGVYELNLAQVLWRPPITDSNPPPLIRRSTQLLGNVASVGFAYYGDLDDNGGASWHDGWSHPIKLPAMVALDVVFSPGDPRRWDRLILPIYAAESAAVVCPPRGRCR
jgi:prepilin-type N-terminal cleavage/methylation domain-containing protein